MATITVANRSFKGISNIAVLLKNTNTILNFSKPQTADLNPNIEVKSTMSRTSNGNMTKINTYVTGEQATLTLSYGQVQPEFYALATGRKMVSGNYDIPLARNITVPIGGAIPAALTGYAPKGTVADTGLNADPPTSFASYTDETGASTALTQVSYTGFTGTTDNQFAIGADGALKFSDNLVGEFVTVRHLWHTAGKRLSSNLVGEVAICYTVTSSDETVTVVDIPNAIINPSGATLSASGDSMNIVFDLITASGCSSYVLTETRLLSEAC